jgi:hypothetical protein
VAIRQHSSDGKRLRELNLGMVVDIAMSETYVSSVMETIILVLNT